MDVSENFALLRKENNNLKINKSCESDDNKIKMNITGKKY